MSDRRAIFRSSALVASGSVAGILIGIGREVLFGKHLGAGVESDSYLVALFIPALLADVFSTAAAPALMGTFSDELEKRGLASAYRFVGRSLGAVLAVVGAISIAVFLFSTQVVSWVVPGASESVLELASILVRVTVVGGVLGTLAGFLRATLEARKRFVLSALQPIFVGSSIVIGILAYAEVQDIRTVAWGMVVGHGLVVVVGMIALGKEVFLLRLGLNFKDPAFRRFVALAVPVIVGALFAQVRLYTDHFFGSQLETGTISSLHYARRMVTMLHLVLGASFASVVFPYLTTYVARGDRVRFRETFERGVGTLLVWIAPAVALLLFKGDLVIRLVLERGQFDAQTSARTAPLLMFLSIGIIPHALNRVCCQAFFAKKSFWLPVLIGFLGKLINVFLCWILLGPLGARGIAIAASADIMVSSGIRFYLLRRIHDLGGREMSVHAVKILGAALTAGLACSLIEIPFDVLTESLFGQRLLELVAALLCIAIVYFLLLTTFGIPSLGLFRESRDRTKPHCEK